MTLTETSPAVAEEAAPQAAQLRPEPSGLLGYLGTGDHKRVGRLYMGTSLLYLLAGAGLGVVLGLERVDQTGASILDAETYFQALTLDGLGLVFLVVLPLILGLAISVVPLQLGARTIAFPRAAAASYWGYLVSGGMVVAAYVMNGGPGGGEEQAVDLWILAQALLVASLLLGAICVVTTVITLRTPGMYLDRVPLFSWSMLVAGSLWLLTLPVALAGLLLAYLDHRNGRLGLGGNYDLYPWLHWVARQPQVFLYAIPALGIISEVVAVMASTGQRMYRTVMGLIGLVGALGFGAWTVGLWSGLSGELQEGVTGFAIYDNWVFVGVAVITPLVLLLLFASWAHTLARARFVKVTAPLIFSLGAAVLLLAATVAAAMSTAESLDLLQSSWPAAVADLALAAAVVAALGGMQYWSVKLWGVRCSETAGSVAALAVFGGALLAGLSGLVTGANEQADLVLVAAGGAGSPFDGVLAVTDTVDAANAAAVAGWALLAVGVLMFLVNLIGSAISRGRVPVDPWGGHTLEWATSSPPAPGNFESVALVISERPLLDFRSSRRAYLWLSRHSDAILGTPLLREGQSEGSGGGKES